eukprot:TRINITY_DN21588_c1_g1_i1.p1 TRINITY_DN21588_c1_g1~~TRINITY_DN21588_c1_g1_i1.p1  ORF type:complete len:471 (+),score=85.40 TRINITY_DN21588_c1_g1_i1:113-1525(+)
MFLHAFVAEKSSRVTQVLCEVALESGVTRAARIADECLRYVDPVELARVRGAANNLLLCSSPTGRGRSASAGMGCGFAASLTRRSPSPGLRRTASAQSPGPRGSLPSSSRASPSCWPSPRRAEDAEREQGMPPPCRRRSSSLRRGERPGDVTNVHTVPRGDTHLGRSGLFDIEMPHRCGLKAFVVIDRSLVFACVTLPAVTRDEALPLLRGMRREFLHVVRPDQLISLSPAECSSFSGQLADILASANAEHGHSAQCRLRGLVRAPQRYAVRLNVYNILEPGANARLAFFGVGLHHTGVEVHGREWSYGGSLPDSDRGDETGVFCIAPRTGMPAANFKETIEIGTTTKTAEDIDYIVGLLVMTGQWKASDYHILHRNCNDFCSHFIKHLGDWDFPSWINRAAKLGAALLPDAVVHRIVHHTHPQPPPMITSGVGRTFERAHSVSRSHAAAAARRMQRRASQGMLQDDECY